MDRAMQKHAVVPPTARELEAYNSLLATSPARPLCDKFVLCVDTEDWQFTSQMCHLAVLNQSPEATSYRITRREVLHEDLVPEVYRERLRFFQSVFVEVEGSTVSQQERDRLHVRDQSEFTYGEIEFIGLIALMELVAPRPNSVFWDLGCGVGKCLVAMALLCPSLKSANGVELLPALCDLCKRTVQSLRPPSPMAKITVVEGDLLKVDWSGADLVYMASICFPDELMDAVVEKSKALKVGAVVLTLKNFPENDCFEVRHQVRVRMTWGKTAVFVLQKVK